MLVGLGLREFSITPQLIPEVKQVIRHLVDYEVRDLATRCMQLSDGESISRELRLWTLENLPEVSSRLI